MAGTVPATTGGGGGAGRLDHHGDQEQVADGTDLPRQASPDDGAGEEGAECAQAGRHGEPGRAGSGEPDQDHVAGHVGREHVSEAEEAHGIDEAADDGQGGQGHHQRQGSDDRVAHAAFHLPRDRATVTASVKVTERARRGAGDRSPAVRERMPRMPAHQVTTRNLGAAYPFIAEAGLGQRGVVIGDDLLGGSFVFDPFELYAAGVVSNPNMVVFGQIGRGKSAFVKSFLWRQAVFGRRAWVVDPKGEYADLADAWGVRPVALRPGRCHPAQPARSRTRRRRRRRARTPRAAGGWSCSPPSPAPVSAGRSLPRERAALGAALAEATRATAVPTVPVVVEALLTPSTDAARSLRTEQRDLLEDGRDVALELRRLVHGDLRGMFDGPTTVGLDLSSPLVVLDLSALYSSAALGVLMACATAWLQAALARTAASAGGASSGRGRFFLVVDEAWAILSNLGVARWLQSSWKLSRAFGVSNVAVLHRVSDLRSVGASDSEQVALAQGLLSDSETRVVYAQSPGELEAAAELLSLSATETDLLPQLRRGIALWKVGQRSFLVQHRLSATERRIVDTDAAMTARVRRSWRACPTSSLPARPRWRALRRHLHDGAREDGAERPRRGARGALGPAT